MTDYDDAEPDHADHDPDDLAPGRGLPQDQCRDDDRQDHLRLQHERCEAGGHADREGEVEQDELPETQKTPDQKHVPPADPRRPDEEDGGDGHQEESQGEEYERRNAVEPLVDDHEVEPPDGDDDEREEAVPEGHMLQPPTCASKYSFPRGR